MPEYPKEQLSQLYKNLPKDLQEALFSEENTRNLREICLKNGVMDEDIIFKLTKNLAYVFLGLLPPNELQGVLEKELNLKNSQAEQIASEISRYLFLPLKKSLEALYKIEIKPGLQPEALPLPSKTAQAKRKPKKQDIHREQDIYKEPIK